MSNLQPVDVRRRGADTGNDQSRWLTAGRRWRRTRSHEAGPPNGQSAVTSPAVSAHLRRQRQLDVSAHAARQAREWHGGERGHPRSYPSGTGCCGWYACVVCWVCVPRQYHHMRRGRHKGDTAAFRDAMFATLCKVWNPRIVPLSVKLGLFRAVVGSVLLYNAECWLVHKAYSNDVGGSLYRCHCSGAGDRGIDSFVMICPGVASTQNMYSCLLQRELTCHERKTRSV